MQLKSTAHCTEIHCVRHSYFTIDDTLLPKHFKLQYILENMKKCNEILEHKTVSKQKAALQKI